MNGVPSPIKSVKGWLYGSKIWFAPIAVVFVDIFVVFGRGKVVKMDEIFSGGDHVL